MKVGTKSVLIGAHAFWLHPWFVAAAWWRLYGFPWDPRLWIAFFVHDLGYIGKPNMDGPEGETHPFFGARIMTKLFDGQPEHGTAVVAGDVRDPAWLCAYDPNRDFVGMHDPNEQLIGPWGQFALYHSRFLAKAHRVRPSRLCIADKLAICMTPWWLYLPMVSLTDELKDYMQDNPREITGEGRTPKRWYLDVQAYVRRWVEEHRDGRADTWTPERVEVR